LLDIEENIDTLIMIISPDIMLDTIKKSTKKHKIKKVKINHEHDTTTDFE
jgi:hypothetical protein